MNRSDQKPEMPKFFAASRQQPKNAHISTAIPNRADRVQYGGNKGCQVPKLSKWFMSIPACSTVRSKLLLLSSKA